MNITRRAINRLNLVHRFLQWKRATQDAIAVLEEANAAHRNEIAGLSSRLSLAEDTLRQTSARHDEAIQSLALQAEEARSQLRALHAQVAALQNQHAELAARQADFEPRIHAALTSSHGDLSERHEKLVAEIILASGATDLDSRLAFARRGKALLVLRQAPEPLARHARLGFLSQDIADGAFEDVMVKTFGDGALPVSRASAQMLLAGLRSAPNVIKRFDARLSGEAPDAVVTEISRAECQALHAQTNDWLNADPHILDFVAAAFSHIHYAGIAPNLGAFENPRKLGPFAPAEPRRRTALFLHNSYYHFNHLSEGLRRRGWDATTVSVEDPESPQQQFYHGEDINLFDRDPTRMKERIDDFLRTVPERFEALHFCGMGQASFFPTQYENSEAPVQPFFDFRELRRHRTIIGYMPSGCLDGAPQSGIRAANNVCARCVWEARPDVCSDARNLAWAARLNDLCDWIGLEGDWVVAPRTGRKFVRGPVVTALDPELWRPGLTIPQEWRIDRKPGTLLVYHAVGNYDSRRNGGRDIKGTGAVLAAIEKLKARGFPIELFFATDVPSKMVRYLQAQADVVVDQLNYGRYGANARESLMLGLPVIVHLDPNDPGQPRSRVIDAVPALDATEATIETVLAELLGDPGKRRELGAQARAFALDWHGRDACAARYEKVIDRVRAGQRPDSPDLYPLAEGSVGRDGLVWPPH